MNKFFKIILASFIFSLAFTNIAKAKEPKDNLVKKNITKNKIEKPNAVNVEDKKFYIGLDASFQHLNLTATNSNTLDDGTKFSPKVEDFYERMSLTPSIFAGIDIDNQYKIETFFMQTNESKINNNTGLATNINAQLISSKNKNSFPINTNYTIKTQTIGFDFKPYKKLDGNLVGYLIFGINFSKIEMRHQVGVNIKLPQYNLNTIVSAQEKKSYNRILPSIGIGLEYFVMPNLRLRTQFKYSHLISNSENDNNSSSFELNGYSNLNFGTAYYF
jgi:opacity protein-like surface antigen